MTPLSPEPREDSEPSFDDRLQDRLEQALWQSGMAEAELLARTLNLIAPLEATP